MSTRRTCYFSGRVQGVGFRYTAQAVATKFPVTGFVRNLSDGRVELVMEGTKENLDAVLDRINDEMQDNIQNVATNDSVPTGEFHGFVIRR